MVRSSGRGEVAQLLCAHRESSSADESRGCCQGLTWLSREMMGGSKQSLRVYQDCNSVILKWFFSPYIQFFSCDKI